MKFEVRGYGSFPPCWEITACALNQALLVEKAKEESNLPCLLRALEVVDLRDLEKTATTLLYWEVRSAFELSEEELGVHFQISRPPYEIWKTFDRDHNLWELSGWKLAHALVSVELINPASEILSVVGESWESLVFHPHWPAFLESYVTGNGGDTENIVGHYPQLKGLEKAGSFDSIGFFEAQDLVAEVIAKVEGR